MQGRLYQTQGTQAESVITRTCLAAWVQIQTNLLEYLEESLRLRCMLLHFCAQAEMLWSKLPSQNLSEVGRLGKLGNQLDFQQCSQCFYNLIIFAHTLKR